jgi:hypothetical protein
MAFFLGVGNLLFQDSLISGVDKKIQMKVEKNSLQAYKNIMGGYTRYMSWEKLPSYKLGQKTTFSL